MDFENSNIVIEPILDSLEMKKIEDRFYFGEEYKDYMSNSRLGLINPEQIVRKDKDGNPVYGCYEEYKKGFDNAYRESFFIGSIYHQGFLQPEYFELCDSVERPSGLKGYIADTLYNESAFFPTDDEIYSKAKEINYYGSLFNENKFQQLKESVLPYLLDRYNFEKDYDGNRQLMYLNKFQKINYRRAIYNLNNTGEVKAAMHPISLHNIEPISLNEEAIILHFKVTVDNGEPFVLKLKAKLDNLVINKETNSITVNDLKTHSRDLYEFENAIIDFHYYRELAIYAYLLGLIAKRDYGLNDQFTVKGNFIVVTSDKYARVGLFNLNKRLFEKGIEEYRRLIKMVAYHTYYGI